MNKKISIIIPCYNQSDFLIETCNSLILQTHKNWEAIIIDDGSTDDTKFVADKICEKDSRFNYFYKENGGSSSARNYGLDKIKGDYIQFLDGDDILTSDKFEKSLRTSYYDVVISDYTLFRGEITNTFDNYCDLSIVEYSYSSILTKWDIDYTIPIHCALFSSKIIGNTRFNESLKAKEDWVFWLEIFKKKPNTKFINEKLAYYRLHQNSKTQQKRFMYTNTKSTMNHIYNSTSEKEKHLFIRRVIDELIDERAKSDYLFKVKDENDTTIANKNEIIFQKNNDLNNKEIIINKIQEDVKINLSEIDYLSKKLLRIKKSIIYRTLVKLELFIRGN